MPKLLLPSQMAVMSFFSRISRVEYSGRSRVLKQVCATGRQLTSYTF